MIEIGGYFELELNRGKEYHHNAIRLNLGRTAFEYILRAKCVNKVFLPYYTCEVMVDPIIKVGTDCEFYHINEHLEPVFNYASLGTNDYFLYTNYFGLKDKFIRVLAKEVSNLIIDNSQAFFSKPLPGVDTFYSPRKFFGVADGGYLYTNKTLPEKLKTDNSAERFSHLIGRIENGAEESYVKFKANEKGLCDQPIKEMSKITQSLLRSLNYSQIAEIRIRNFQYLHEKLSDINLLHSDLANNSVTMTYPLLSRMPGLREYLIQNKIFVAQYWPYVLNLVEHDSIEYKLVSDVVHLPLDQRYNLDELNKIISLIKHA